MLLNELFVISLGGGGSVIGGVGLERVREQYAPPPLKFLVMIITMITMYLH